MYPKCICYFARVLLDLHNFVLYTKEKKLTEYVRTQHSVGDILCTAIFFPKSLIILFHRKKKKGKVEKILAKIELNNYIKLTRNNTFG